MARATGKATKKNATKKRGKRRPEARAKKAAAKPSTLHWTEQPWAFGPDIVYAYHRRGGKPVPICDAMHLPELVGLLIKACQYFEIADARFGPPGRPLPPREALETFFRNQRLVDGGHLSRHRIDEAVRVIMPSKGGRRRKAQSSSPADELNEGMSPHERERILLRMVAEAARNPPSKKQPGPDAAPPDPENR